MKTLSVALLCLCGVLFAIGERKVKVEEPTCGCAVKCKCTPKCLCAVPN